MMHFELFHLCSHDTSCTFTAGDCKCMSSLVTEHEAVIQSHDQTRAQHKTCSLFDTQRQRRVNQPSPHCGGCSSCDDSNPSHYLAVARHELAKPAVYIFSSSRLDVPPAESTVQSFIHPTGSLTVNKLKMVILLSGNTTWHRHGPPLSRAHIVEALAQAHSAGTL